MSFERKFLQEKHKIPVPKGSNPARLVTQENYRPKKCQERFLKKYSMTPIVALPSDQLSMALPQREGDGRQALDVPPLV